MSDSIAAFVADLAQVSTGSLVNQYATEVDGLDRHGGAAIRCANLRQYLASRRHTRFALIGEAPSAHGARFSGIAFTAERSFDPAQRTSAPGLVRGGFSEHSATVLRGALVAVGLDPADVVLWNAVPFHPVAIDDPLRNRRPTVAEVAIGLRWLDRFLALMEPSMVVAVGRTAAGILPAGTPVVRHPANGGSGQLRLDLAALVASATPSR